MAAEKKRQLHYELLRIAAMLMIVSLHYLSKGGPVSYTHLTLPTNSRV